MEIPESALMRLICRELGSANPENVDDGVLFPTREDLKFKLNDSELESLKASITSMEPFDDSSIVAENSYEMLIALPDSRAAFRYEFLTGDDPLIMIDPHQAITYRIGRPSPAFLLAILHEDSFREPGQRFRVNRLPAVARYLRGRDEKAEAHSVLDVLEKIGPYYSLRIESDKRKPGRTWRLLADALLFHLGYNLDASLVPRPWRGDLSRPSRVRRFSRHELSEIDVPRRGYVSDLVHHYQLGISSDSPMLQYISFYHVAEHWFESIYHDDLVGEIQAKMTDPAFSFRRKKDIESLIKKITKSIQLRDSEVVINEQVALRLTLQKYVNVPTLISDLSTTSEKLIQHYATTKVQFSDGDTVRFDADDPENTFSALSRRIYKTRNSIVHSKDGARGRFIPYADDHALVPEIPLMRLIAEQIIISTSTEQVL